LINLTLVSLKENIFLFSILYLYLYLTFAGTLFQNITLRFTQSNRYIWYYANTESMQVRLDCIPGCFRDL